jgi:4-amino-4-deoxy-L-arabinose transferase-like glycosyltransferase
MRNFLFRDLFKKYKIEFIIFSVAIILRLALFFINLDGNHGDFISTVRAADGYYEISSNLIAGNGYSDDVAPNFTPNSLRPPLWIFIMAGVAGLFGSYVPVFVLVVLLGSSIPLLAIIIARRYVDRGTALAVGWFLAFEPTSILNSTWFATETSFTFFFLIFCLLTITYLEKGSLRLSIWSGVFLGFCILIKPTVQFLIIIIPFVFILLALMKKPPFRILHGILFALATLLIISPWLYRNYAQFGKLSISSQAAFNLYTVLVPTVISLENNTNYESERLRLIRENARMESLISPTNASEITREALSIILDHKVALIKSVVLSVVTFFTHDGILTVLGYSGVKIPNNLDQPVTLLLFSDPVRLLETIWQYAKSPALLILIGRFVWILVTMAFFAGIIIYYKKYRHNKYFIFALSMIAYFAIFTTVNGLGMNARFRLPVNTFILTFAFYSIIIFWNYFLRKISFKNA